MAGLSGGVSVRKYSVLEISRSVVSGAVTTSTRLWSHPSGWQSSRLGPESHKYETLHASKCAMFLQLPCQPTAHGRPGMNSANQSILMFGGWSASTRSSSQRTVSGCCDDRINNRWYFSTWRKIVINDGVQALSFPSAA
jgi:hypothetical protein